MRTTNPTVRTLAFIGPCLVLAVLGGCPSQTKPANPFLTATETYGASGSTGTDAGGQGASGTAVSGAFRQQMAVTLVNSHPTAELNVLFAAWVSPSSIRSADQQDALLANGYVQLTREVTFGSAHTLVPGTFVYNGPGVGGATPVTLRPTGFESDGTTPGADVTRTFTLLAPDAVLLFDEPPVSCDSVAFHFTEDGLPLDEGFNVRATQNGGRKTLAQVDAYQCSPFKPGLFLRTGGGARQPNEFFEGEDIQVNFSITPNADGFAAVVLFGDSETFGTSNTVP